VGDHTPQPPPIRYRPGLRTQRQSPSWTWFLSTARHTPGLPRAEDPWGRVWYSRGSFSELWRGPQRTCSFLQQQNTANVCQGRSVQNSARVLAGSVSLPTATASSPPEPQEEHRRPAAPLLIHIAWRASSAGSQPAQSSPEWTTLGTPQVKLPSQIPAKGQPLEWVLTKQCWAFESSISCTGLAFSWESRLQLYSENRG
jgi:hypothetical protein